MPPEALDDNPVYDASLDIFSYGAVTLYVITQQWPKPKAREKKNPSTGRRELVSEIKRRQKYLDKLATIAPNLWSLVCSCLDDNAVKRPLAEKVSEIIKSFQCKKTNLTDYSSKIKVDEVVPHVHLQVCFTSIHTPE